MYFEKKLYAFQIKHIYQTLGSMLSSIRRAQRQNPGAITAATRPKIDVNRWDFERIQSTLFSTVSTYKDGVAYTAILPLSFYDMRYDRRWKRSSVDGTVIII